MASRPLGSDLLTAFSALGLSSRRISAASPAGTPYMPAAPGNGMAHPAGAAPAPGPEPNRLTVPPLDLERDRSVTICN